MNKIKHKNKLQLTDTEPETILFPDIIQIIEKRKFNAISAANNQIVLMFWGIGKYIKYQNMKKHLLVTLLFISTDRKSVV